MKVGIFILHYNTPELTEQLHRMVPEAIVVDNGSDKGKKPIVFSEGRQYSNCNIHFLDRNYGFTVGWNKAIKDFYHQYDAFWLMNSDIVISRKSVDRICQLAQRDDVHFITPSFNCWIKLCRNYNTSDIRKVKVMEFTAPLIKKSVFDKIGLFDENFSLGWGVEFDFCYRAAASGFNIHVDDASNFYHIGHKTITATTKENSYYTRAAYEWKISMQRKYGSQWQYKLYGNENFRNEIRYAEI